MKLRLSKSMSIEEFDNGYWYAAELRDFAERIGVPAAKRLRKDELERAVKRFLSTGRSELPTRRALSKSGMKDIEHGLSLDLPVVHYTSNKETKAFIHREAIVIAPSMKKRSGVSYRLNRWREEQLAKGIAITYRDLVRQYISLNQAKEPFARIPHGRYINFVGDFLAAEKGKSRTDAIAAWEELKKLDVPKDYLSWKKHQRSRRA